MPRNIAKAHAKPNRTYSQFHQMLLGHKEGDHYALHHLYNVEATRVLLQKWGWSTEDIKIGCEHITIDVMKHSVYLHIPNKIVKRGETIKIKGLSRHVSKGDYVQVLIDKAKTKSDPYKLQLGDDWNRFIALGNTGDFYEVEMREDEATCTCHAYRGLMNAFEQDAIAYKILLKHPVTRGQLPDKHIFAVWKYLSAETFNQYQHVRQQRYDSFLEETNRHGLRLNQYAGYDEGEETGF
ncbi:MAG: hypothetical protein KME46_33745 [Brasilonema angustatum HA4187-MV1]|jgi:hypothetical protein|nr:hypothetical protein [Brasilonema angustatum HA4187-MV1]